MMLNINKFNVLLYEEKMRMWAILLDLVTKARFLVIFSLIFFSWASVQEWQMCRTRTSRRRSGGISPTSTQPFLTPAGATAWSCSPPASMGPGSFLVSSRLVNRVLISITFPGAIYYMILYIHGDLALTESKEEPPCIDNVSGFLEFLGPRGPLVLPLVDPYVRTAQWKSGHLYTGIYASWIIRRLLKPTHWPYGIP